MLELKETIELMVSENYKDRFIAEYWQTRIRVGKLAKFIGKYQRGELDFTPSCPVELLEQQADIMLEYLDLLAERAEIEGVELGGSCPVEVIAEEIEKALEWLKGYTVTDHERVYSNGAVFVPLYRVEQAFKDRAFLGFHESN